MTYNGKVIKLESLSVKRIGIFFFEMYVFSSYFANDTLLPSFVSSYTLYLFCGFSLLYVLLNKKFRICDTALWMVLFLFFSFISMSFSSESSDASWTFNTLIINFVITLLLTQYNLDRDDMHSIGKAYMLSSALMILALIATGNISDSSSTGRLGEEIVGNANALSTGLMFGAVLAVWILIYHSNDTKDKIISTLCLVANYYGMFLSGGRKYIVVPIIFLYIMLIFKRDKVGRRHFIKHTVIVVAIVLAVMWLIMNVPIFYEILGSRFESLLSFMNGDVQSADASTVVRNKMIDGGMREWTATPIFGHGFDSFKVFNAELTGYKVYSHNNFVEMLYNGGIVGFILYYGFYAIILIKSLKNTKQMLPEARVFGVATVVSLLFYEVGAVTYISFHCMQFLLFAEVCLTKFFDNNDKAKELEKL